MEIDPEHLKQSVAMIEARFGPDDFRAEFMAHTLLAVRNYMRKRGDMKPLDQMTLQEIIDFVAEAIPSRHDGKPDAQETALAP